MRNFFQKKVWVILLATLALGALTVLAVSLSEIKFREPQQYQREAAKPLPPISFDDVTETWKGIPLWKFVVVWSLVGVLIVLVALLLSPEQRKHLVKLILRITLLFYVFYYLFTKYSAQLFLPPQVAPTAESPAASSNIPPMPVFKPPNVSPLVIYLVSFACVLAGSAIILALYWGWKRYNDLVSEKPLDEIAHIARSSLRDLSSGFEPSDVIINCYLRMSEVVADKRHLHREAAVTPREFALRLERAGLPADAVSKLTGLFETVRYGDRKSAPRDVTEAVNCLNAILRSCGEVV